MLTMTFVGFLLKGGKAHLFLRFFSSKRAGLVWNLYYERMSLSP